MIVKISVFIGFTFLLHSWYQPNIATDSCPVAQRVIDRLKEVVNYCVRVKNAVVQKLQSRSSLKSMSVETVMREGP